MLAILFPLQVPAKAEFYHSEIAINCLGCELPVGKKKCCEKFKKKGKKHCKSCPKR